MANCHRRHECIYSGPVHICSSPTGRWGGHTAPQRSPPGEHTITGEATCFQKSASTQKTLLPYIRCQQRHPIYKPNPQMALTHLHS